MSLENSWICICASSSSLLLGKPVLLATLPTNSTLVQIYHHACFTER
jgi:hypothetical protein